MDETLAPAPSTPPTRRGVPPWVWIAVSALVVAAIAVTVALVVMGNARRAAAEEAYTSAVAAHATAVAAVEDAKTSAQDVEGVVDEQVADVTVLQAAESARDRAAAFAPIVPAADLGALGEDELTAGTAALNAQIEEAEAIVTELTDTAEAVRTAVAEQTVAVARGGLEKAIAVAQKAYDDSAGKVTDEKVRATLKTRLTEAAALVADESATPEALEAATKDLNDAAKAVAGARLAQWSDLNGTWCLWNDASQCMTVSLPEATSTFGSRSVIAGPHRGDAKACFTGGIGPKDSDGGAMLIFCPKGASVSGFSPEFENTKFDRVYITQSAEVSPWFRKDERKTAIGG